MGRKKPLHIAVIGVDGSGKSSCYEGLLKLLAQQKKIAGIGDQVFVADNNGFLKIPDDIIRIKVKQRLNRAVKLSKKKIIYQIGKMTELIVRSKIYDILTKRYAPHIIISDGAPLINMLGWGRYYHPQYFNKAEYIKIIRYLTRRKRIPWSKTHYYLKNIPELFIINNIFWVGLKIPDIVIFLKVDAQKAIDRIAKRGEKAQAHEHKEFLAKLQEAYAFALNILKDEFATKVFEIDTNKLTEEEVLVKAKEIIAPDKVGADINVIATTISGSIKDWKKLDYIEEEFKQYFKNINVFILDSHHQAFEKTKDIIKAGGRKIISAGGAGTFNSVLEGCCTQQGLGEDLRLAFLRKGSADLIGKVLNIPDDLFSAVRIISNSIKEDLTITSDILEVKVGAKDRSQQKYHMIGFGGAAIFGAIPYFTESRFIKYYKGILGYLFGDRGPFLTGANLAIIKHYWRKAMGRKMEFKVIADTIEFPFENYSNILIINGDLGKHFPVAKGLPLDSGDFEVILTKDRGIFMTYKQLIHAWKGDLSEYQDKLGIQIFRTKSLKIIAKGKDGYLVNVDGQLRKSYGETEWRMFGKVELITG